MAVYREGFYALEQIQKASVQIFDDACDFGAPTKIGDKIWNYAKQLVEWYGIKGTRKADNFGVVNRVELIDEWAVSDERKTMSEATMVYEVEYLKCVKGRCKGYNGFISISRIK